jgi:hypothetical protein
MWKYILGNIALFAAYIELSPNMGNVWIRKDENNIPRLQLHNLLELMKAPLSEKIYWYPKQWDINVFTFVTILFSIEQTFHSYFMDRYR